MFTGIIENTGVVKQVLMRGKSARLSFAFKRKEKQASLGESIAVNGVCLTAVKISASGFSADLLPETLTGTTLGGFKPGAQVNLERSLKLGSAMGGHWVSGHVDSVGEIVEIRRRGGNWSLLVHAPKTIISKLQSKGSVAIDGVSLTVQVLKSAYFQVAVIPHTLAVTTLHFLKVGSRVNLELDHSLDLMRSQKQLEKLPGLKIKDLIKQGF